MHQGKEKRIKNKPKIKYITDLIIYLCKYHRYFARPHDAG